MRRRSLLILGAGSLATPAFAQAFPSQAITLICAWPAGGGSDIAMRLVAEAAAKKMGVPVVVENRPGAAGSIGHRAIVTARPDGYTIGMFSTAGVAAPYMNANANTLDEFEPLAFFGSDPSALQASNASGIASLADFVARAKASPGKVKNGNDQPGGASFLAVSSYERLMGFRVQKVPYAGYAPTVTALLAGEVDSATVGIPDTIEHHRGGRLKILGVSAPERHFMAPEIPTFKELDDILDSALLICCGLHCVACAALEFVVDEVSRLANILLQDIQPHLIQISIHSNNMGAFMQET